MPTCLPSPTVKRVEPAWSLRRCRPCCLGKGQLLTGHQADADAPSLEEKLSSSEGVPGLSCEEGPAGPVRHRMRSVRNRIHFRWTPIITSTTILSLLGGFGWTMIQLDGKDDSPAETVSVSQERVIPRSQPAERADRAYRDDRDDWLPVRSTLTPLPSPAPAMAPALPPPSPPPPPPPKENTAAKPAPAAPKQQPAAVVRNDGTCQASFYGGGDGFDGKRTASGRIFDSSALTAAHPSLKFGTIVRVTNPANGKSVDVEITDRGPYAHGRCLDLSKAAFTQIAPASQGVATVQWGIVG